MPHYPPKPAPNRFILPFFDHAASPLSFEADATCETQIEGQTRKFLLKIWRNFVFFTLAPQTQTGAVWGITTPLALTFETDDLFRRDRDVLGRFFERELHAGHFGFFDGLFARQYYDSVFYFWRPDGRVMVRSWWDDRNAFTLEWPAPDWNWARWFELDRTTEQKEMWLERHYKLQETARINYTKISPQESERWAKLPSQKRAPLTIGEGWPILERHKRDLESWGLERVSEVEKLTKYLSYAILDADFWEQYASVDAEIDCATPTHLMRVQCGAENEKGGHFIYFQDNRLSAWLFLIWRHLPIFSLEFEYLEPHEVSSFAEEWPVKAQWVRCQPATFRWQIAAPTAHERMEATLELRDWLDSLVGQGRLTASDAQILWDWPFEKTYWGGTDFYSRVFTSWPRENS